MTLSRFLQRLASGDDASGGGAASLRNVAVWLFIALVALFLTQPSGGPFSAPGMQVPWPAELGLDGGMPVPEQGGGTAPSHRHADAGTRLRSAWTAHGRGWTYGRA
ncbi:hypothetical protein HH212_03660 [Massilia forsythiae]|uniref:Uncharacterized protein n=1 Tax=Massilia forsythiae TaxID=2728020 RepID=A0A7Z2VUP4_9BURK|nr:hypothetical protein [Massilia forsythiae]QJD99239.1 hypothetical protein HH212_03660 [Massilia forsythiae]